MTEDERLFHYNQGLKHRIEVEIELSKIDLLAEAMRIADRMDNIFARTTFDFNPTNSGGPEPMEIGMYLLDESLLNSLQKKRNKLSE